MFTKHPKYIMILAMVYTIQQEIHAIENIRYLRMEVS